MSTWTQPQLEAAYNWEFVSNDGSLGIHNTAYAVGLLKASIANLTGDANNERPARFLADQLFRLSRNPAGRTQCHQQHQQRSQLDDVCLGAQSDAMPGSPYPAAWFG